MELVEELVRARFALHARLALDFAFFDFVVVVHARKEHHLARLQLLECELREHALLELWLFCETLGILTTFDVFSDCVYSDCFHRAMMQ